MNSKILSLIMIYFLILESSCLSYYNSFPIWESSSNILESNAETAKDILGLECESAILIEQTTGKVLYEKNSHAPLRPASVTKVMTLLLIMESINNGDISLDTQIPCSNKAADMGGSQIWLNETETLTVNEMLKAICVVSANDCTYAMAEYLAGSEEAFVEKMNEKAKSLGMNDTTFKNCHGIDEDNHISSSYDISLMAKELLNKYPQITQYTTIWMDTLRNGKSELTNTNKLIRTYDGITGLKTGSTSLALYNLAASATRNNLSLIAVVMRAPTSNIRFQDAKKLLDYGFANYSFKEIAKKGTIVQNVPLKKGIKENVDLVIENDYNTITQKGSMDSINSEIKVTENIEAPINKNDVLGTISYYDKDTLITTINLVANDNIQKKSLTTISKYVFLNWMNLLKN